MRVATWNVNGLRAVVKRGDLERFLDEYQPDVLLMQEIKMNEMVDYAPEYEKFDSYALKKGYSGTSVWVRLEMKAVREEVPVGDVDGESELTDKYGDLLDEGRITTVKVGGVNFVSVYVPNSKRDLTRIPVRQKWDEWFKKYLDELDGPVVCGGDFNVAVEEIDLARPKENRNTHGFTDEERAGMRNFLKDYQDVWREENPDKQQYTWWSHFARAREKNIGWRIDYLITRGVELSNARILGEVLGSDHVPVMAELDLK
ncbi:exodeoxyribonuclease III [Candidatus Saccharibacteria bacterium]|nr:exodeoxyribonuclease III [Candidatus Saccharibacteria bacterium]